MTGLSSKIFYFFAAMFAFFGVVFLLIPFIGLPLLGLGWFSYAAATRLRREARAQAVRRQLGG